ncbi:MAG: hypothetical protein EBU05_02375 [Chitinophagia bacterium]|nr:hypothetical protein [Chitinophagia bacterium]
MIKFYTMKKLIFILAILVSQFVNAQNTVWRKMRIAPTLVENYESDKANKKLKLGECFIVNSANRELARGMYKNGLKDSIWNYFSQNSDLIQVYDFTNKKLIYNIPDVSSIVKQRSVIDTTGYVNAKVVAPVKIGGLDYGFYLLYNQRNLPQGAKDQKEDILMEYIFDVSATGKLEDFNIKYTSTFYNADFKQSIKDLHGDAYEFIPASINGNPVKSKLVYQIMLYISQARDRGTYNVPTQKF